VRILARVGAAVLATCSFARAHGGGLDGYGCHHNRKAGGYHCHRGALAGRAFSSQQEMRNELAPDVLPYAGNAAPSAKTRGSSKGSVAERLKQLDRLRSDGLITDAEYAERRRAILDDL